MKQPLISVVIPAYNAVAFLEQAVQSVLRQTYTEFEVLIVDDSSTDDTMMVIASLAAQDNRVRHFISETNRGPGHARNIGMDNASGEWVTFLDADDWYESERLEKLLFGATQLGLNIVADNQKFIVSDDGSWKHLLTPRGSAGLKPLTIEDYFKGDHVSRRSRNLGLLKPMIRRDLLERHHIRYDDLKRLTIGEDFYFLLECLKYEKRMAYVTDPLYNYRIYDMFAITKRQTIESYIEWKNMHRRFYSLFDPATDVREFELMVQRENDIDTYIQMRRLVEPLKQGEFGEFFAQVKMAPKYALALIVDALSDPCAMALFVRYYFRNLRLKLASYLR